MTAPPGSVISKPITGATRCNTRSAPLIHHADVNGVGIGAGDHGDAVAAALDPAIQGVVIDAADGGSDGDRRVVIDFIIESAVAEQAVGDALGGVGGVNQIAPGVPGVPTTRVGAPLLLLVT